MRNLKRALSLALASVMLLGMMVVGTGASYADVTSKHNEEAIEVLQAIGVMSGDTNGNFNPDQKVTRGEMAVVMTNMLGLNVNDYASTTLTFTDVPDWGKGFVAACLANGIAAGYNDKQFGFNDSVTTAQAALMMMKALGYFQYASDFGGDWQLATVKQASKIDLFNGINSGATAAMTRNEVAQIALNTLEANVVEAEGNDGISIGDITIGSSIKYVDLVVNGDADSYANQIGKDHNNGKCTVQLGEQLFKGDLKKDTSDAASKDAFGRPGYTWVYEGKEAAFAVEKPVAVFTAKTSADDMAKALSGYKLQDNTTSTTTYKIDTEKRTQDVTVKVNVYEKYRNQTYSSMTIDLDGASSSKSIAGEMAAKTANGVRFELYADSKDVITDVVMVKYTVGEVTKVSTNKDGDVTYTIGTDYVDYANPDKKDTIEVFGKVAEDDIVTYVVVDSKAYVYPTTKFVGAQSAKNDSAITVSGTKYDVALGVSGVDMTKFANSKDNANYYVDQYGYVVKTDAIATETNYAVVDKIALVGASGTAGNQSVEAILVFADGSTKTVNVSKINGYETKNITSGTVSVSTNDKKAITALQLSSTVGQNGALTGMVVTYTEKSGKYELTYETMNANLTTKSAATDIFGNYASKQTGDITAKGVPGVDGNTAATNNSTKYLVKTDDDKFVAYTGFKNVPTITADTGKAVAYNFVNDGSIAEFVYIDASNAKNVGDTTTGDIFYVTSTNYSETLVGDDTIFQLTGILNGKEGTIKMEAKEVVGDGPKTELEKNKLYELKVDNDGYVTAATEQKATGTAYVKETVKTEAKDGVIVVEASSKNYTYSDSTKVIVIDGEDVISGTISAADAGETVYIKTVGNDGADAISIEVIYIINK